MCKTLLLTASCLLFTSHASAEYSYDAIRNAKARPDLVQTLNGQMAESHRVMNDKVSAADGAYGDFKARVASAPPASRAAGSSTSGSAPASSGNFECTFVCQSPYKGKFSDTSSKQFIRVQASDRSSAESSGISTALKVCREIGYHNLYTPLGKNQLACSK